MNVAFPANRRRVAENLGHRADRGFDVRLRLLSVLEFFLRIEGERFVFSRVLFLADANERPLEQLHDRRQYLVSWEPRQFQVPRNSSADFRQRFTEADYAIVFVFVANFAPALVIKILFATARI